MGEIELRKKQKEFLDWMKRTAHSRVELEKEAPTQSLRVNFRCSKTGRDWAVLLERENESSLFKVTNIITGSAMSQSDSKMSSVPKSGVVDIDKIENHGNIKCPHCKDGGWVKCGCGKLSCAGGVEERDSRSWHVCPWCGHGGFIGGTFETISGEMKDEKRKLEPRDRTSLPKPHKALPP